MNPVFQRTDYRWLLKLIDIEPDDSLEFQPIDR